MNTDMGEEPLAEDVVRDGGDEGDGGSDAQREHEALVAQARDVTLPGEGASDGPPATFLGLMGIAAIESRHSEDDVILVADPDDATESESASTRPALAEEVYIDEQRALTQRLQRQQRQHDRLIEKVAAGVASSEDLARSRRELRDTKEAMEDAASLAAHARVLAQERAQRTKVINYYQAIDRCEESLTAAVEDAEAIDSLVTELGAVVERFRGRLESITVLRKQAFSLGGRAMLEALDRWMNEPAGLELEVLNRLKTEHVLSDRISTARPGYYGARRVAPWTQQFASELVSAARQRAPVIEEAEEDGDAGDTNTDE